MHVVIQGTPLKYGADNSKRTAAYNEVMVIGSRMNHMTTVLHQHRNADKREKECLAAFVVFNNHESLSRCVDDYYYSSSWLGRLLQRPQLRLKRSKLCVQVAPPPSDIIWENLQTSYWELKKRKFTTYGLTLVLLLMSLAVIIAARTAKYNFDKAVPDLGMCSEGLPATVFGGYDGYTPKDVLLERPVDRRKYDDQCKGISIAAGIDKSFWIAYTHSVNRSRQQYHQYSISACHQHLQFGIGLCPRPIAWRINQPQCPCVDPQGISSCKSVTCAPTGSSTSAPVFPPQNTEMVDPVLGRVCQTFPTSTIAGCYCKQVSL